MTTGHVESLSSPATILRAVVATFGVGVLLISWPVLALTRFQELRTANLGVQLRPEDPLLLIVGVLWIGLVWAIVTLYRPLRRVPNSVTDVGSGFREAIAATYLGLGDFRGWTASNPAADLDELEHPDPDAMELVDQAPYETESVSSPSDAVEAETGQAEGSMPLPTLTTEYTVGRRESWWSIAETLFNDSSDWSVIRDLNIGREVADGLVIESGTALRSGWTLIVPVEPGKSAPDAGDRS